MGTNRKRARVEASGFTKPVRRFLLRFAAIASVLLAGYYFPYDSRGLMAALFRIYLASYAHVAGAVIALFDPSVRVHGTQIAGRASLEFAMSCDAMDVFLLFAAATLASPLPWSTRLKGLAVGFVSVAALNVIRIASLYFVAANAPARFDFVHLQVWPLAIVLFVSSGFLAWLRWAQNSRSSVSHDAAVA